MSDFKVKSLKLEEIRDFIKNEVKMCIPLGSESAYSNKDIIQRISDYLLSNLPNITVISETKEVRKYYSQWNPLHWIHVLNAITGDNNICYITDWNFDEEYLIDVIPEKYNGKVLKRGNNKKISILVEWNESLLNENNQGFHALLDIWNYGTEGFILPKTWRTDFERYTSLNLDSREIITRFLRRRLNAKPLID